MVCLGYDCPEQMSFDCIAIASGETCAVWDGFQAVAILINIQAGFRG